MSGGLCKLNELSKGNAPNPTPPFHGAPSNPTTSSFSESDGRCAVGKQVHICQDNSGPWCWQPDLRCDQPQSAVTYYVAFLPEVGLLSASFSCEYPNSMIVTSCGYPQATASSCCNRPQLTRGELSRCQRRERPPIKAANKA